MLVRLFTLSNFLSFLRLPLALLFLPAIPALRVAVLIAAALTDYFDGYLARKWNTTSQLGAVLDPVMDKAFIYIVLAALIGENLFLPWEGLSLITRDFALVAFCLFLGATGAYRTFKPRAVWWGKVVTVLQYLVLVLVVVGVSLPPVVYGMFILLGVFYLAELAYLYRHGR